MEEIVERELKEEVSLVEQRANAIQITNEDEYKEASSFVKQIKVAAKKVTDYWEPLRKSTYDAYKNVTTKKSEMEDPLKKAEKTVKGKISAYTMEVERKRREAEEAIRKAAEEELVKKMKEAEEAEKTGDLDAMSSALAQASVLEQASVTAHVAEEAKPSDGIIKKKDFVITKIDAAKVPISVDGVEIRPVDEKAVIALIRATKGQITIPGVEFEETYNISVRA